MAPAVALLSCSEAASKADLRLLLCTACVCKLSLHPLQRCDMLCKSCTVAVYMEVCNNRCTVFSELPRVYCATLNLNKTSWVRPLRTSRKGVYNLSNASCLVPPRFSDTATNAKCHFCYCNLGCDTAVDSISCTGSVENLSPYCATWTPNIPLQSVAVRTSRKDASADSRSCKASVWKDLSCVSTQTSNILLSNVAVRIKRKDAIASPQPALQLPLPCPLFTSDAAVELRGLLPRGPRHL